MGPNMTTNATIEKLDSSNFHTWKFKMQMDLEERDLWDTVDESELRPTKPEARKAWENNDRKALATICLGLLDTPLAHMRHCKTAVEAWARLSQVHEAKGLVA